MGNFILYMKQRRFISVLVGVVLVLTATQSWSQGCNSPASICQSDGTTPFDTYDELPPIGLPADLCFSSSNTIFIEFNTLSQEYINSAGINFVGNAEINITSLVCDTVHIAPSSISAAVVSAVNPCIANTYGPAIDCIPPTMADNLTLTLENLLPDTVYYLIINTESAADASPFRCDFEVNIDGPAVLYDLGADAVPLTVFSGQTTNLTSNSGFADYQWEGIGLTESSSQNTSAVLQDEGVYTYTVSAQTDGCEASDQVVVNVVPALTIYNTLTPNGDGINDTWVIEGIQRFPDAEVLVYSRWGQLVHRARGYQPWDGGGLPEAVYYYVIELNPLDFDTKPYTGTVTIIR